MAPLPSSRVIPVGWSEHHRPVAKGSMTGELEVLQVRPRTSIADTGGTVVLAAEVPCRVQQLNRSTNSAAAGQAAPLRDYLVTLPHDTAVDFTPGVPGQTLRITKADNPRHVGLTLTVKQVMAGSLTWELGLICEHHQLNGAA